MTKKTGRKTGRKLISFEVLPEEKLYFDIGCRLQNKNKSELLREAISGIIEKGRVAIARSVEG